MDRDQRPTAARHALSALSLVLALALAGCAGRSSLQVGGTGVPHASGVPSGVSASGGSVSINIRSNSTATALIAIGLLGGVMVESERGYDLHRARVVPPMDGARAVNEQDCSKPIEDLSANLRCR